MAGPGRPLLCHLYVGTARSPSRLYAARTYSAAPNNQGAPMADILVVVLGTGGILLMAAYAALCDRI